MGLFSIILGAVIFVCFSGAGAFIASKVVAWKNVVAQSVTDLANYSNFGISALIIFFFAFIGLLIGMNLIMHGITYRKQRSGTTSLGVISILLGVIALCLFVLAGFFLPNLIVRYKSILAMFSFLSFLGKTPDALIFRISLSIFTAIGLLICVNMTMHG